MQKRRLEDWWINPFIAFWLFSYICLNVQGKCFFSFRNLSYLRQHKADVGCARGDEEFALNFSVIFVWMFRRNVPKKCLFQVIKLLTTKQGWCWVRLEGWVGFGYSWSGPHHRAARHRDLKTTTESIHHATWIIMQPG